MLNDAHSKLRLGHWIRPRQYIYCSVDYFVMVIEKLAEIYKKLFISQNANQRELDSFEQHLLHEQ